MSATHDYTQSHGLHGESIAVRLRSALDTLNAALKAKPEAKKTTRDWNGVFSKVAYATLSLYGAALITRVIVFY